MSTLTTNTAPRQLAINKQDVAALVEVLVTETIKRLDARETSRMISNAVKEGVTKHLEAQRTAGKPAEDIFDNYKINPDTAADYMNNLLEQK